MQRRTIQSDVELAVTTLGRDRTAGYLRSIGFVWIGLWFLAGLIALIGGAVDGDPYIAIYGAALMLFGPAFGAALVGFASGIGYLRASAYLQAELVWHARMALNEAPTPTPPHRSR